MTRLFASEFLRAVSRRALRLMAIGCVTAVLLGVGIATAQSTPPSRDELKMAEQLRDRDMKRCLRGDYTGSETPEGYASLEEFCEDSVSYYFYSGNEIRSSQIPEVLLGSAWLISLLGAILGATYVGADMGAGTMTTLLTWEPRRLRVLLIRAAVAVSLAVVVAVAFQTLFALVFRIGVAISGSTAGEPSHLLREIVEMVARNSVSAALFCVLALAAATLTRSTAGGLGVIAGYLLVVEGFISAWVVDLQRWLLLRSLVVFINQEPVTVWDRWGNVRFTIGLGRAGIVMAAWVGGLLVLALLSFRSRDAP